jgi:hypothetical protein
MCYEYHEDSLAARFHISLENLALPWIALAQGGDDWPALRHPESRAYRTDFQ